MLFANSNAGANMPSTDRAIAYFHKHGVVFGNGKAANAGVWVI